MPVDADKLEELLKFTKYDEDETKFLVNSFKTGFDIGYRGDLNGLRRNAPNLKFHIGNKVVL